MMSLVAFGAGGWDYAEREIAGGLDDYHAGRGEAPGVWVGSGATAMGLSGRVEREQLGRLFDEARHPNTGEQLGRPHQRFSDRQARCGFGLTFSAPKSASTLWAVGGPDVSREVRGAHVAAVDAALGYLERHAAFSRKGKAGVLQVDIEGLVAAAYVHRTSRAQDPQLHSHVLVANRVRCADGVWRALDARELYGCQKAAGALYQAALRVEVTRRLGVAWTPTDTNGQAEIVGVPAALCAHFSTRRRQVEAAGRARVSALEAELGRSLTGDELAREYQAATYATRPPKDRSGVADETLVARWEAEAADVGFDARRWLPDAVGRADLRLSVDRDDADTIAVEVTRELTEGRSTWSRAHVTGAVARRLDPETWVAAGVVDRVETLVDAVLAHPEVVRLVLAPKAEVPASLARADGKPTVQRHGGPRYTTQEILRLEGQVLDAVSRGRDAGLGVASMPAVEGVLADAGLSDDQARAMRRVTTSGHAIECVVGPAGAGKSHAMRAARLAWEASGHRVRGLAVSAVAAGVLAAEAGMHADTLAKFLFEDAKADPASPYRLQRGEVVVLDEASMVSTRDLARLVNAVDEARGKLVLVGDHRQLGAVEAGGLFRLVVADGRAAELEGVRRFAEPWEAAASLRLRERDPGVIDTYAEHRRVIGGTRDQMIDAAFGAWIDARAAGRSIVVVAPDHATVDQLAAWARQVRVAAGEVEPDGVDVAGQTIGVGDEIVTCHNDRQLLTSRRLWVRNGDRWHVTARTPDGALDVEHLDGRGRALLSADYVAEHVALSYALTVHKTQGLTVDHCVLVVDDRTAAEHAYVGMTRGRIDNRACVVCEPDEWGGPTPDARHVLAAALARSIAEVSATETLQDELAQAESLRVLYPAWLEARDHIDTHAGADRRPELDDLNVAIDDLRRRLQYLPVARHNVEKARTEMTRASRSLAEAEAELAALDKPRPWWQSPEPVGRMTTRHDVATRRHWTDKATAEVARTETVLRLVEADQPKLEAIEDEAASVAAAVEQREAWLDTHPTETAWEADLRDRIVTRTRELGLHAAQIAPRHLVGRLGPVPPPEWTEQREHWVRLAGRVEAYRERWSVGTDRLGVSTDTRGEQARHWQRIQLAIDDAVRAPIAHPDRVDPARHTRVPAPGPDIGL